jgi:hypothetical protein
MKLVIVESPYMYRDSNPEQRIIGQLRNVTYARLALNDCILKGEAPYASHLLLTQPFILNDDIPEERDLGINAGLEWGEKAEKTVLYKDLGISSGMEYGLLRAEKANRPVETRVLNGWKNALSETPRETLVKLGIYTDEQLDKLVDTHNTFKNSDVEFLLKP